MNILYKYLPIDRSTYFDDGLLRITQPDALNDPFDCLPANPTIDEYLASLDEVKELKITEIIAANEPDTKAKLKSLLIHYKSIRDNIIRNEPGNFSEDHYRSTIKYFNEKMGLISFSRRWNSNLMWSHYSSNHKGFCIGFDRTAGFFSKYENDISGNQLLMDVEYNDMRIKLPNKQNEIMNAKLLYTKSTDWDYEEETRLILELGEATKKLECIPYDIYLYQIPFHYVKEITIGAKIDNELENKIRTFAETNRVDVFKCVISKSDYNMDRVLV